MKSANSKEIYTIKDIDAIPDGSVLGVVPVFHGYEYSWQAVIEGADGGITIATVCLTSALNIMGEILNKKRKPTKGASSTGMDNSPPSIAD